MVALKKDPDQKIKERRNKIDAIMKGSNEPVINFLDYRVTLIQALNWYNVYASPADKKKWALDAIDNKLRKTLLSKLDENYFRQIGILLRLKARDQYLDQRELTFIEDSIEQLDVISVTPKAKVESTKPKNVISIQDRIKKIAVDFAAEIDGEIDEFITLGYPKTFVFKNSVKTISGQAARLIPDMYKNHIQELEEVLLGECEDLKDSYSHIKTVQIKNFLKLLNSFVASCTQQVVSSKKVKVVKSKSAIDIVSKMKYLPVFTELDIKSITPSKIIDSKEVWLYDTVTRKISYYKATDNDKLTVKGTTIIGYDTVLSLIKVVKPNIVKDFSLLNKKQMVEQFTELKSKGNLPFGRTNENTIILRIF
jgi:hypothetical protein